MAKSFVFLLACTIAHVTSAYLASFPMQSKYAKVSRGITTMLRLPACTFRRSAGCKLLAMAGGPPPPNAAALSHPLAKLLSECKGFGFVRFISVNPNGSVLETAARMDLGMSGFTVPGKGQYITIASEDKLFECHINLDLVRTVTITQEPAKIGGHTLHVMRLKDGKGAIMLSCMLQYDPSKGPGSYFPGAVEAFETILKKHGSDIQMPASAA